MTTFAKVSVASLALLAFSLRSNVASLEAPCFQASPECGRMENQALPYLTQELKTAIKSAYRGGKPLGSTEKEAAVLLDELIKTALSYKASDIHLQNLGEMKTLVKFRIDGVLQSVVELSPNISDGLISRLIYITRMRLDSPLPQDGRFGSKHEGQEFFIRVSVAPTRLGEDATLRLLADVGRPGSLDKLEFRKRDLELVKRALKRPHGMILVCGPTSSGKTTTLYLMIEELDKEKINICTIEDPIEYVIPGTRQIQVDYDTGLDFALGLRAILRHDPDVIFVGEIRDRETAGIAVDAALTGHLLFSSVHANSAPETVTRMRDLGIRPYLIAATLNLIVGKRLVRRLCQRCKVKGKPHSADVSLVKVEHGIDIAKLDVYEGKGCEVCQKSGYKGRIGIFEVLKVSEPIKELILNSAPVSKITDQARKEGFTSMFEDGLEKVKKATISLPDLLAATG